MTRRRRPGGFGEAVRGRYDSNSAGNAAPHFDGYALFKGRIVIPREELLGNIARVLGTDLYIVATK